MTTYLLITFISLAAIIILINLWSRMALNRFLRTHVAIDDSQRLSDFKTLVRQQMYVALAMVVIGGMFVISALLLTIQRGFFGLVIVVLVAMPIFLLGRSGKKLEIRTRTLPCPNPELDSEYRQVGHSWTSKLFPDF